MNSPAREKETIFHKKNVCNKETNKIKVIGKSNQ